MLRNFLFIFICLAFGATFACTSTESPNSNANIKANNSANVPPEFSGNTVTPSGNATPGIPDPSSVNANNVPKGATPTPGIPDAETLKRQANTVIKDANLVNNPTNVNRSAPPNERKKPNPPGQ